MAHQVIFKKRFYNNLVSVLNYIEKEWNKKVADDFLEKLDKRISTLKEQPFIGSPSEVVKGVRGILITKHNKLYYKVSGDRIFILNMPDTQKSPKKNRYL